MITRTITTVAIFFLMASALFQCAKPESGATVTETVSEAAAEVNDLPPMRFVTEDQHVFSAKDLSGNTILVFFRTECDHCQREAAAISENLEAFGAYQLYFVGTDGHEASRKFAEDYALAGKGNIHFVQTDVNEILDNLGPIQTPSMYIYSRDRRLVRHLDGEKPIEEIMQYL